ncbi:MAG: MGMT family protein [Oscillospiraceae bacterium]|nr:MGMT family protein [Oscillospiraceae bacterium]
MSGLYKSIFEMVKAVPEGMVTTYGQLAAKSGNPRRSRIIGGAMARCNDSSVPCHRVVRKDGSLPSSFGIGGREYQRFLLENEGVTFLADGRVDMGKHLWTL